MNTYPLVIKKYTGASSLKGPLLVVEGVEGASYRELVEIITPQGKSLAGQVNEVLENQVVIQLYEETYGLNPPDLTIRFRGHPLLAPVAKEMLGRIFNGLAEPIDNLPAPIPETHVDINGLPINPSARIHPASYIETGISAIDCMNTLVQGQKLPLFSISGLRHNELATQIARQARITRLDVEFAVVFAAMGITHEVAESFQASFRESGAMDRAALFLNLANDPSIERIVTPRMALSLAEYLAFRHEMHLLVILTDMTNYGEALREMSNRRGEVPTRRGYPGYMYSDLAQLYERCGRVQGHEGSITLLPILTMPNGDITHPIPDLTGYITEGQIVLSSELDRKGIYPPINVLPSLSRLMKDGIGEGETRADHQDLSNQLYSAYTEAQNARNLAEIIGESDLPEREKHYLRFGEAFEQEFLTQGLYERRTITQTLDLGWKILGILPREELTRVSPEEIALYYHRMEFEAVKPGGAKTVMQTAQPEGASGGESHA